MKKLFVSIIAIAALAACAKEEIVSMDKGEAIQFGNAFVNNATRAADPSYSANDIESFVVYGTANDVVIYPGTTITKGTADYGDAWTCPVNQYWVAGAAYKFVGIVDGAKDGVTNTTVVDGMPTTISYTADGETDLLCQTITKTAKTDGTANGLVAFNFTHLLSKVNFTVNNTTPAAAGYSFEVKNIKFNGNTAGVYNITEKTWGSFTKGDTAVGNERIVDGTTVKDIVVTADDKTTTDVNEATNELTTEVLFLPGTYTVSFTVDILYNGKLVTTTNYPATGTTYSHTLEAANAYNFVVNVAVGKLIEFTVEKQPTWGDGGSAELK